MQMKIPLMHISFTVVQTNLQLWAINISLMQIIYINLANQGTTYANPLIQF